MVETSLVVQVILNGLIAGGILALVSIGYNLIYGILKFINFAHGEVGTFAAFLIFFFLEQQIPLLFAAPLTIALTALLGLAINQFVYKPLRNAPSLSLLVGAIAVSLILQALVLILFSAQVQIVKNPFPTQIIEFFGARITVLQIVIIALSLFLVIATESFLRLTTIGKQIRATADNPELAKTIGIDTERVIAVTFVIASMLAAVAGIMVSFEQPISFVMGVNLGIRAFAASVIGGIGSIYGSFIGGYVLGLAENLGILFIPSGYKDAIGFTLLIIFLLIRPTGILHTKLRRI